MVEKTGEIWGEMKPHVRKVIALDMESYGLALEAQRGDRHWLVVKGVSDHADPQKDDSFREFAARAAAEVLFAFLRKHARDFVNPPVGLGYGISSGTTKRKSWCPPSNPPENSTSVSGVILTPSRRGNGDVANVIYLEEMAGNFLAIKRNSL